MSGGRRPRIQTKRKGEGYPRPARCEHGALDGFCIQPGCKFAHVSAKETT